MQKQALVIGLGQFGLAIAKTLAARGTDVLAVDISEKRLAEASRAGCEAAAFDATQEEALARAAPARRDLCVCAIGDEARESAIIVTALLRQMGAPRIVSRATDQVTERILKLVGAHEVVNPERAYGERLASRIFHAGIVDALPLGDDMVITEMRAPAITVGRNLAELDLSRRFNINVVAIRRSVGERGTLVWPNTKQPIERDDILVVVAREGSAQTMIERIG